jgi:Na+-driven multidrug efflux pump
MWIALVVTVAKLAGNAVLIFGLFGAPRLELWGAGLATVISQAIGLALFLTALAHQPRGGAMAVRLRDLFERNPMTREVVRIAIPGVLERIVLNLGLLSYFAVLSRWYGTLAVATYTVGVSLLSFSWIPGTGFAQACSTLVGQTLGAGNRDAAMNIGRRAVALAFYSSIPLALLFAWLRAPLSALFTDDAAVIAALSPFMLTLAFSQPFLQIHFTLGGAHRGAGDTVTPLVAAMIGNWLIRLPAAILIASHFELDVFWIWVTLILDHVARTIWLGLSFLRGKWRDAKGIAV